MDMPPAWKMTYDVQARGANGPSADTRLSGTRSSDWFEIVCTPEGNSPVVGRLSVITAQPYRADAEPDCLRKAIDLCHVLTVANGNWVVFEPVTPPEIEQLEGAKQPAAGIGIGVTASLHAVSTHGIENARYNLEASTRIRADADLRADLDTWRLANTEDDAPTRLIHYFRNEREANAIMVAEPQLLSADEIDTAATVTMNALPDRLYSEERDRVGQTVKSALARVRTRSRGAVLSERLTALLSAGRAEPVEVTTKEITEIDKARGRYAHRSAERDAQPAPQAEQRLRKRSRALAARALDLDPIPFPSGSSSSLGGRRH
jgi:hypothetical protein